MGGFSYTSYAGFIFIWRVSLTHPTPPLVFCREFLLHIPYLGSFCYTAPAGFLFIWGVSLTHPVLASFLSREFLLHIPCCLHFYLASFFFSVFFLFSFFFNMGSFSFTSYAGFIFIWRVSLTHPTPPLVFCGEFLLHIPCWLLFLTWGVSLTHPMLASFSICGVSLTHPVLPSLLSGDFLLHIPCRLYFSLGSFSDTSHAGFFFFLFLIWEFLLHIPC